MNGWTVMAAILIDTNVLVYAHDREEPVKQERAINVLEYLHITGNGRLSTQCLAEFFRATTRASRPILTSRAAMQQGERLARVWPVYDITPFIVIEAMRGVCDHQLAYWDAQIWATARLNQIPIIFSEDFNTGSVLEGVRFVNPFAGDFSLSTWG
jgi:predicted nucleic acid-binding protein